MTDTACTLQKARSAKRDAVEAFERVARVVGVGITRIGGGYGLKVNLDRAPAGDAKVPSQINGVPVRVEVVGTPRMRKP